MPENYIASFESGEVTKALYGRIDSESYPSSALEVKNLTVQQSGGVRRREGTTYYAETVENSRLIGWRAFGKAIIVELQPSLIHLWDAEAGTKIAVQDYDYSEDPDTQTEITSAGLVDFDENEDGDDIVADDLSESSVSFADVWKVQYAALTKNSIAALVLVQEYENPLIIFAYNDGSTIHYGLNFTPCPSMSSGSYHDGSQPRCVGRYSNRLIFGNFEVFPNRYLTSNADALYVSGILSKTDGDGTRDQYAVIPGFSLAAEPAATDSIVDTTIANEIRWIQGREDLYFGTDEAIIRQHSKDEIFSYDNASKPIRSSEYSASFTQAFVVNESLMFLNSDNTSARAIQFSNDQQQYYAPLVSQSASHLLDQVVRQVAYVSSPAPRAYFVTEDGNIAVLNYDVIAQFANWSHFETDGEYQSVATVQTDSGTLVFFIVKRTYDDGDESDIYLIEKKEPYTTEKDDMHYVDAGKITTGSPVTEVTGLTWLRGKEVSILADGAVLPPQTVPESGDATITIPEGFEPETVHVGLRFDSRVIPMPFPEALGNRNNIERLYLVLHETIGGVYGVYNWNDDEEEDEASILMDSEIDESPDLFSGVLAYAYPGSWEPQKSIYVGQSQPLPFHLLSIRATYASSGRG